MPKLSDEDLDYVLEQTRHLWHEYRGRRVFVTGATGFVGSWMLETLSHVERQLQLGIRATVLVRDENAFYSRLPHLASTSMISLQTGDVRTSPPPVEEHAFFVHCASAAKPRENVERPDEVIDLIERGTTNVLECAAKNPGSRFLQISSGSIYGPQPSTVPKLYESFAGRADASDSSQRFGAAKMRAESVGREFARRVAGVVTARIFALLGPRLPGDGQFAIGDFLSDARAGRAIALSGDGTPVRSWMYAADMAVWCWTLLTNGRSGVAYNVGSEEEYSLWDAAHKIGALAIPVVAVARKREPVAGASIQRFVPSTEMARNELGLATPMSLDMALARTWEWLSQ